MNKLLLVVMLMLPMAAHAKDDQSIVFEIGVGFGNSSGGRTDGNDKSKFCKNRNQGRMVMGAIRYRYDDTEAHVARWFHDDGNAPKCDRDSWAVGLGYVIDTQGNGISGRDDAYASWTPGLAYTWGKNKDFTGQSINDTNWRNTGNVQVFNRLAVGTGNDDYTLEVALHRYGTFNPYNGENFVTVGGTVRDLEDNQTDAERGLTPPVTDGDTTINNITNISITNNGGTTTPPSTTTTSVAPIATTSSTGN